MVYEGMDAARIGERIRALREEKHETAEQLATSLNISTSAIAMYENGNRIPRDEIKIRIAEHFAVTVESIFFPNKQHELCEG